MMSFHFHWMGHDFIFIEHTVRSILKKLSFTSAQLLWRLRPGFICGNHDTTRLHIPTYFVEFSFSALNYFL